MEVSHGFGFTYPGLDIRGWRLHDQPGLRYRTWGRAALQGGRSPLSRLWHGQVNQEKFSHTRAPPTPASVGQDRYLLATLVFPLLEVILPLFT